MTTKRQVEAGDIVRARGNIAQGVHIGMRGEVLERANEFLKVRFDARTTVWVSIRNVRRDSR